MRHAGRALPRRDDIRPSEGNNAMILMLSVRLAATAHAYLDAYAPTNILIRTLRGPCRQRLAMPVAAVLAIVYGLFGAWLTTIIHSGGPGWLNPFALLCAWNTIKFSWLSALEIIPWLPHRERVAGCSHGALIPSIRSERPDTGRCDPASGA